MKNIIEECYSKSIDLLVKNSTSYGIIASTKNTKAEKRNYDSIFARDLAICSLGIVASKQKKLIKTVEKSLISLSAKQARNGQIPNYVKPEIDKVDFWYIGCLDATLWWLIAVKFFDKYAKPEKTLEKRLSKNIAMAINWLEAHEHQKLFLLEQNEASDWADIMPRSGFVLYSNVLWFWVKKLYSLNNLKETKQSFNYIFYPWQKITDSFYKKAFRAKRMIKTIKDKQKKDNYYLSFVNYMFWGEDIDVLGNSLAILTGLINEKTAKKIMTALSKYKRKKSLPMPVLFKPIEENSRYWRDYMIVHKDNYPFQYHNGGIWPFASCFWTIALAKIGRKKEAEVELEKIAKAVCKNNWQFNEWLSPKSGQPMGISGQSWNAGMLLAACQFLKGKIKF